MKTKNEMPNQEPLKRIKNFSEVALGYTKESAILEARRCLECKNPKCVEGCPVNVDIPKFIRYIKEEQFLDSYKSVTEQNLLPAICGRVCPQESQCEAKCIRGIKGESVAIGRLERFIADWYRENSNEKEEVIYTKKEKVAVIGSGPSGLTCAGELCKKGYQVTIYEALHIPGGVLSYGIPEFRLPKKIVEDEINNLKALGVEVITNVVVGKTLSLYDIFNDGFKAIYLATGAGLPRFMGIKGENLRQVYSANEFLTRINLMKANSDMSDTPLFKGKNIAVIGGGNVAMDAARCALRTGASSVNIIYRRSEDEMPARLEEIKHAKEEGIKFHFLIAPIEIIADDAWNVKQIKCVKMELIASDDSGRRSPVVIPESDFFIESDMVIMAIGNYPNPLIGKMIKEIKTDKNGCIIADSDGKTTMDGVYAGGDAVSGAATVILAMGAGKTAAKSIEDYLSNYSIK